MPASSAAARPDHAPTKASPGTKADFIAALKSDDLTILRDALRAAGCSNDMVRSIIEARLWKKYEARFKVLNHEEDPAPEKSWWKNDRHGPSFDEGFPSREDLAESLRLQRELEEETKRLLGPDPDAHQWNDQRLSFLPLEKRESLQKIEQDYDDLIGGVQRDAQGFNLPSDIQKLRLLEEEKKRDIAALMTPAERQAYDLRVSPTAQTLMDQMTRMDATEEEYLKIFPLQKAFDEKYNPEAGSAYDPFANPPYDEKLYEERNKAEKQLQAQIKAVIGEARYAESIKQQDNDYQQLQAATRRLALPPETPDRLYALRDTNAAAIQRITENSNLAPDQKKKALATLAVSTREQVIANLGREAADAYFKNSGMRWLKELEQGNPVIFNKDDASWDANPLPTEEAAQPPAK